MKSLYIIKNLVNGKIYIGQTKDIVMRWHGHRSAAKHEKGNMAIHKAIRKYGEESFSVECLLTGVLDCDIDKYERLMIKAFDSTNKDKGYNICSGGIGGKGLWKEKNGMYGRKRPDLVERNKLGKGRKLSEEHKYKIRPNGRKHTLETKTKQSVARKILFETGKIKMTDEIRKKISETKLSKSVN